VERTVILYDADCGFCRWALSKILARDHSGRLRPVALQDPEAEALLPGMNSERRMSSWHLVRPDGRIYSGGEAVPALARMLRGGAPVAALAEAFPRGTNLLYGYLAARRDRIGRLLGPNRCSITPTSAKA
jgi:predicted DCC family thiol-disulfide oxidoreductase YuxK